MFFFYFGGNEESYQSREDEVYVLLDPPTEWELVLV